jgi:hypothetical protein
VIRFPGVFSLVEPSRIKVIYLAGAGRSGSTILDNLLGQMDGFCSVGEIRLWAGRYLSNDSCGCGALLRSCEQWDAVLKKAYGGRQQEVAEELYHQIHAPLMALPRIGRVMKRERDSYLQKLERIYRAVREQTDAKVIVDSSKFPLYAAALQRIPVLDLYVIHLVRDARAVAYSWRRQEQRRIASANDSDPLFRRRNDPVRSAVKWNISNLLSEFLRRDCPQRYLRLRYEDFIAAPRQTLCRLASHVGEAASRLPFAGESQVRIERNHAVSGNPIRFRSGTIKLVLDDEWKSSMRNSDKMITTWLAWPLLKRYEYL